MENSDFAPQLTQNSVNMPPDAPPSITINVPGSDKPDAPQPAWYWLKDSSGHPSMTVTMMAVSFWITAVVYVASIFQKIGPFEIREFNVGATSSFFIPILTLYFGCRWTESKYGNPNSP